VKFTANHFIYPFFKENLYLELVPVTPSRILNRYMLMRLESEKKKKRHYFL